MHNKILIIIIIILSLLIIKKHIEKQNIKEKPSENWVVSVNNQNKNIKKIYADLSLRSFIFDKKGYACYEKQENFRMSVPGKLEVGSDQKVIWFWSDSMVPKSLYFCDKEKIKQSRLKKIFYPNNLLCLFCVQELPLEKALLSSDSIEIREVEEGIEKVTLINNNGISEYLFYENNILILDIKVINYQKVENFNVPKEIYIKWILEEISLNVTLKNVKINNFRFEDWNMPNYKSKVDLSTY